MNITFGITTDYSSIERLDSIINSINLLNIPKYEILIIGNKKIDSHGVVNYIEFDESIKPLWITKKKNIINLDKFYNKFNKETREDGKTKISTNTFGI